MSTTRVGCGLDKQRLPTGTMNTFEYIQSLSEIRKGLTGGELPDPSWVRITTITMCSKFLEDIDLPKFRENFKKLETVTVRRKGSKFGGFEWRMADTAFYNQVTIGYRDAYSRKSIKIFPNGSIQVAGCSDLLDCRRILRQLSFILKVVLGREHDIPVDKVDVKMINTNFSLNSSVNLNKIIVALGSSANQARINYLDERIEFMESIYKERNLIGYDQDGYAMEEDEGIIPEKKAELNNLIEERQSLGEKMPYGKFKVTYDPDRYSAVKVKFVPGEGMKQVTASIFSTGKIIVTGAQTLTEIAQAYSILNQNLRDPAIYVKTVSTPETFDTILGAKFDEWVRILKTKTIEESKPVKRAETSVNRMFTTRKVKRDYANAYAAFYALDSPTDAEIAQFMGVLENEIMNLDDQDKFEDLSIELEHVQDFDENYNLNALKEIADKIKNIV